MKKAKKLHLSRETLRHLANAADLHEAAGGATTPLTKCAATACVATCICNPSVPPGCSVQVVCTQ
jgi:hypothetical protein